LGRTQQKKKNRCEDSWGAKSSHHLGQIQSLLFILLEPGRCRDDHMEASECGNCSLNNILFSNLAA
jgi:hypothetical protein